MSIVHIPVASLRPVWDAVVQAIQQDGAAPDAVPLEVDADLAAALARGGWAPVIHGGRRTATVRLMGEDRTLSEMSDADLQRWLIARDEAMTWLMSADGPETVHARAQAVTVPLVAMALGISEDAAWDIAPAARREIVHAQEQLNESAVYGLLKDEWTRLKAASEEVASDGPGAV